MLKKFLLGLFLPVLLSAQCDERGCRSYRSARVHGGDETEPHSRPFQVALYSRVGIAGPVGFCGGSLIHQEWVLTAAHCCFHHDEQVTHVQAILGAHSLYDRYENGRRVVNVDELVIHPGWDPVTFANDLALMKLANVVQLSETVDIVRLPYLRIAEFSFAGLGAVASGWGIAAPSVTFVSPTLRQKSMTVMTDTFCNSDYLGMLPGNNICGFNPTSGICRGDNGGPMTIFWNSTEETILVGVTSFVEAIGCNEDHPSVFTRVQRYLNWISEVTGIVLE